MNSAGPECASHHEWALWRTGADFCFFNCHLFGAMSANLLEDLVSLANGCVCYPVRK